MKKIFNRNTLKLCYSCMPNVKQTIDEHNKATLQKVTQPQHDSTTKISKIKGQETFSQNVIIRKVLIRLIYIIRTN